MQTKDLVILCWNHCPSKFSGTTLILILKLAALSKPATDGGNKPAYMTAKRLALQCGADISTIQRSIKELKKSKTVVVKERHGHSSQFYLQPEVIAALPLADPQENEGGAPPLLPHVEIAHRVAAALGKMGYDLEAGNWREEWPSTIHRILSKGHTKDVVIAVTNHVIKKWKTDMLQSSVAFLEFIFDTAYADMLKGGAQ